MTDDDPINRSGLTPRFWERKPLTKLSPREWEALCDGCGKCCLNKLEDEETGDVALTCVACRLFDDDSCRCSQYPIRHQFVPECISLRPHDIDKHMYWLPQTCAYRLLREDYRFDGLAMTDDLGAMKAITDRFGLAEATTRALTAGADMALFSNVTPVAPLLDAAEKALAEGRITAQANDTAVARVLAAKGLCSRG